VKSLPGKPIDIDVGDLPAPTISDRHHFSFSTHFDMDGFSPQGVCSDAWFLLQLSKRIGSGFVLHLDANDPLFGGEVFSHFTNRKPNRSYPVVASVRVSGIVPGISGFCGQNQGVRMSFSPGFP
jgi:hypothetical protein